MSSGNAKERLVVPVAMTVMLAWLAAVAVAVLQQEYTPLSIITPVMLLLAGYSFGVGIVRSAGRTADEQK